MVQRFRDSSLFLFFGLSLAFLWLAFPAIQRTILGNDTYKTVDWDLTKLVETKSQGSVDFGQNNDTLLRVYHPSLSLYYSVDGGDHFLKDQDNQLQIAEIRNAGLMYHPTSIRWRHPNGDFPWVKSIRIKLRDEVKMEESEEKVFTYFDQTKSALPVVSINMSSDDVIGWENGIMVPGASAMNDSGFYKAWWYRSANFANRGNDWAKKVMVHYFDKGELKAEFPSQLRISGNATRYFPQKSMKFYPLDSLGRKDKLNFPFWGEARNKKSESFLLRNGGNDNSKTLFADLLMHRLAKNANLLVLEGFPVSVYINGNYWGIYNLRERMDAYFIAKREGKKESDVTTLYCEVYGHESLLKEGDLNQKLAFDSLIADLPKKGELDKEVYDRIKDQISIKSFIDYIIFETFYANGDWLHNNTTWYKAKNGQWKWILNDLDCGLAYHGENQVSMNMFQLLSKSDAITARLFNALLTKKKFKKKFKNRVYEILATDLSEIKIKETFTNLKKQYEADINLQINRWRSIDSVDEWEKNCANNLTFLLERRTSYLKHVEEL